MLIIARRPRFEAAIRGVLDNLLQRVDNDFKEVRTAVDLSKKVTDLREQVEKLEIEKGRKQEAFDRREREIEHKLGLHKEQVR